MSGLLLGHRRRERLTGNLLRTALRRHPLPGHRRHPDTRHAWIPPGGYAAATGDAPVSTCAASGPKMPGPTAIAPSCLGTSRPPT